MSEIRVYYSSVSGCLKTKKQQQHILMVLDGRKIVHTDVDVTQDPENKDKMRRVACNDAALPPQICNGDQYCGDYEGFLNAVEEEKLTEFLKL
ncbi:unnamed protein product [Arctogadus glacialis]